jgi:hypothetical protein
MGRPPKRNLNYSTWDVDVLENDTSIDALIDAQGPAGFYVYFALCQKAYATDGYYYRWGYDNAASTARKLGGGLKSTQIRAIVDLCVSLGLFDKALFTTDGILTSRAIQSRYLDGIARRTGEIPIIVEYWLLEATPRAGLVFVHKNRITAYRNQDNEPQKPSFRTEDYIRQNEINPQHNLPPETTVEKSVENRRESCTRIIALIQSYTGANLQGEKQTRKQVYNLFDRGYTEQDVKAVVQIAANTEAQFPPPVQLFGPMFDRMITTTAGAASYALRDHYAPLPPASKKGSARSFNGGY